MSFSIGALASGLAGATDRIVAKKEYDAELARKQEEQDYNRERQAVADKQAAEIHAQSTKRNEILINNGLKEQAEQQRVDELKNRIGMLQGYKSSGDTDGAFTYALDFMNGTNKNNASWNQDHTISYTKDPENPNQATLNIVDKNTGQLIKQINQYADTDTLIDMIYSQIDPVKDYESAKASKAKLAEEKRKQLWDERKLGIEHGYKQDEITHKGKVDALINDGKFRNDYQLEGLRQQGAYEREELKQGGENYRLNNKIAADPKAVKQSGGALSYARNNLDQFRNISVENIFNHLIGQESSGNHIDPRTGQMTRSPKGALGISQIMPDTAKEIYKETGIDVYSSADANIAGGKYYLNKMLQLNGGDMTKALAAYNAGNGRLQQGIQRAKAAGHPEKWLDYMPDETKHYVPKILSKMINVSNQAYTQGRNNYTVETSGKATESIKEVSANMTSELGYEGKNSAAVIGGISGLQPQVVKFTSDPTYKGRFNAYQNILTMVERVVKSSPIAETMTPAQIKEYTHQKAAEIVGAKDKVEAGLWIQKGSKPSNAKAPAQQAMDFSGFTVGDNTPPKQQSNKKNQSAPSYLLVNSSNNKAKEINNPFTSNRPLPNYFQQGFSKQNNTEKLKNVLDIN